MRPRHALVALALLSTSARADELKPFQKEARGSFEKALSSALKDANAACGTRWLGPGVLEMAIPERRALELEQLRQEAQRLAAIP